MTHSDPVLQSSDPIEEPPFWAWPPPPPPLATQRVIERRQRLAARVRDARQKLDQIALAILDPAALDADTDATALEVFQLLGESIYREVYLMLDGLDPQERAASLRLRAEINNLHNRLFLLQQLARTDLPPVRTATSQRVVPPSHYNPRDLSSMRDAVAQADRVVTGIGLAVLTGRPPADRRDVKDVYAVLGPFIDYEACFGGDARLRADIERLHFRLRILRRAAGDTRKA